MPTLTSLPAELLVSIVSNLARPALAALSRTSKALGRYANHRLYTYLRLECLPGIGQFPRLDLLLRTLLARRDLAATVTSLSALWWTRPDSNRSLIGFDDNDDDNDDDAAASKKIQAHIDADSRTEHLVLVILALPHLRTLYIAVDSRYFHYAITALISPISFNNTYLRQLESFEFYGETAPVSRLTSITLIRSDFTNVRLLLMLPRLRMLAVHSSSDSDYIAPAPTALALGPPSAVITHLKLSSSSIKVAAALIHACPQLCSFDFTYNIDMPTSVFTFDGAQIAAALHESCKATLVELLLRVNVFSYVAESITDYEPRQVFGASPVALLPLLLSGFTALRTLEAPVAVLLGFSQDVVRGGLPRGLPRGLKKLVLRDDGIKLRGSLWHQQGIIDAIHTLLLLPPPDAQCGTRNGRCSIEDLRMVMTWVEWNDWAVEDIEAKCRLLGIRCSWERAGYLVDVEEVDPMRFEKVPNE